MRVRNLAALFAIMSTHMAIGCGDEPPPEPPKPHNYTLEVEVTDGQGTMLPNVAVKVDEKIVGHTDAEGKFSAVLNELAGNTVTLGVVAPSGYRFAPDTDSVTEILKTTNVRGQVTGVPVFLSAAAESLQKDYFVWVKADCDNGCKDWPVLLDGKEMARTNALGYAHFSFTDQPRNDVEIEIVAKKPNTPSNPKYGFTLDTGSTVYRIEQAFTDPSKPKPVVRRARPSGGKKKDAKAGNVPDPGAFVDPTPKKETGVIDLFGN